MRVSTRPSGSITSSRMGAQGTFTVARSALALTAAPEPNPDRIPGFSDHYGVRSELELSSAPDAAIDVAAGDPALKASLARALKHGIRREKAHRRSAGLSRPRPVWLLLRCFHLAVGGLAAAVSCAFWQPQPSLPCL